MIRLLLILGLTTSILPAQGRFGGGRRMAARNAVMTRLHTLRTERIHQATGISSEKAKLIADRWEAFDLATLERRKEIKQLRQQTQNILMGTGSEEEKNARLRPIVERLETLQKEQQEARQRFEAEIRESLTPAQQARLIMLVDQFQKELQTALKEQRRGRE